MPISSEDFRDVLRHFPSGVTVVTIKPYGSDIVHGLTVSAFASISPVPPTAGTTFAVNILGQDLMEMSNRFAWLKDEDRFAEGDWGTAVTGAPILNDALAWLDCTIYSRFAAGSHTIYVGEVQASGVPRADSKPLVYWNRGYRRLVDK